MALGMQLGQGMALQQVLSPQMQQSLALLQAPVMELRALVEQEMSQNPVLEEISDRDRAAAASADEGGAGQLSQLDPAEPPGDLAYDPATEKPSTAAVDDFQATLDRLVQLDQEWRDHFSQSQAPLRQSDVEDEKRQFLFDNLVQPSSMRVELAEQLRQSDTPAPVLSAAELIIGNLNDEGYLGAPLSTLAQTSGLTVEELAAGLRVVQTLDPAGIAARDLRECLLLQLERRGRRDSLEYLVVRDHLEALGRRRFDEIASRIGSPLLFPNELLRPTPFLSRLKSGAEPLDEFLRSRFGDNARKALALWSVTETPPPKLVDLVLRDLNALVEKGGLWDPARFATVPLREELRPFADRVQRVPDPRWLHRWLLEDAFPEDLARKPRLGDDEIFPDEIQDAAENIARLRPRPGLELAPSEPEYVVPEVTVTRTEEGYRVTTNDDPLPRLRISHSYKDLLTQAGSNAEVRDYLRDKIRAGKFLIRCLDQREQTIQRIAEEIVVRQREFFDHGRTHLKPMTMSQIAEVVGVHETTVSRAVAGKFMDTPQGLIEMRALFTSGVATSDGGSVASTGVKELIGDMVRNEDPTHPLTDDQIEARLKAQGVKIARRTVAKYRTEMKILPVALRRQA